MWDPPADSSLLTPSARRWTDLTTNRTIAPGIMHTYALPSCAVARFAFENGDPPFRIVGRGLLTPLRGLPDPTPLRLLANLEYSLGIF